MALDVTTLVVGPFQENCHIAVDRESGNALIVDPGSEPDRILAAVEATGAEVAWILATHAHVDHVGAVAPIRRALGVPFALHGADRPILERLAERGLFFGVPGLEVPQVDLDLAGVSSLPFGAQEIRVLPTPGHTPGGVTFLLDGEGFFGDTLFRLSVGRTDLGGDPVVYARTLREVVLALPDETVVHTGHGPITTIGVERRENPFLNGSISLDATGWV